MCHVSMAPGSCFQTTPETCPTATAHEAYTECRSNVHLEWSIGVPLAPAYTLVPATTQQGILERNSSVSGLAVVLQPVEDVGKGCLKRMSAIQ